jgi:hypothetical protein
MMMSSVEDSLIEADEASDMVHEAVESSIESKGDEGAFDLPADFLSSLDELALQEEQPPPNDEPFYQCALELIRRTGEFSTKALQKECAIGFSASLRILDRLEAEGIISTTAVNGKRKALVDLNTVDPITAQRAHLSATQRAENKVRERAQNLLMNDGYSRLEPEKAEILRAAAYRNIYDLADAQGVSRSRADAIIKEVTNEA